MARSNTLPIDSPKKTYTGNGRSNRSAPERTQTQSNSQAGGQTIHYSASHQPFRNASKNSYLTILADKSAPGSARPTGLNRQTSLQTRYMNMLLSLDTIPRMHNIYISFFSWILLAGFLIFPGTFTSLKSLPPSELPNTTTQHILHAVKYIPLLWIAAFCCGVGSAGMLWLWRLHRQNYVWLLNKIFLPGCLNSAAGLISTLVNVYSQQEGVWSVMARITAIVTGTIMCVTGGLFVVYNFWALRRVRRGHEREMNSYSARDHEGLVEKIRRRQGELAFEPGSVV